MFSSRLTVFRIVASLVVLGLGSCKGDLPDEADKDAADVATDVHTGPVADTKEPEDAGQDTSVEPDISPPDTGPTDACPGGEGCPCTGNDTCDNAVCLDTHEGKRCARSCVDTCPAGYSCQEYGSIDGAFFCVSTHLSLCAPCEVHADCQEDGVQALCLSYDADGSFCGAPCKADADCPGGYECLEADDGKGGKAKQCRRNAGKACECSAWAKDQGAQTTCTVSNDVGACEATRKCGAEGLEPCAAATPGVEVCNAKDDDCDGTVDNLSAEATCSEKAFTAGGSGLDCKSEADCGVAGEKCDAVDGKCRPLIGECFGVPTCSASGALICQKAKTPKAELCNGEDDDCDGKIDEDFAVMLASGATAVVGEACGVGVCGGGKVVCAKLSAAECTTDDKKGDTESCNGVDDDCDGLTDEAACDDGDACTTDVCEPVKLACAYTAAVDCDDGEACTKDACDGKTGLCSHDGAALDGLGCDDGDACTEADACLGGKCASGKAKGCDDGNPCTDDSCAKETGCLNPANGANCSDDNACTDGDVCKGGKCAAGPVLACGDGEVCTDDTCDAAKGCVSLPNAATCTDGDACTAGDGCKLGECAAGLQLKCDDGEVCTADACDKGVGCVHLPAQASCTDGNACTAADSCKAGKCVPGGAVLCGDDDVCTVDSCDKDKGCVTAPSAATCTDGDACTEGDVCKDGGCVAGAAAVCDDGNGCTDDACDKAKGCVTLPNAATCSDGDACTAGDICAANACLPGQATKCDDSDLCTADTCDAAKGCINAAIAGCGPVKCDDGNACTLDALLADDSCVNKTATSIACNADGKTGVCGDGVCKAVGVCNLYNAPVAKKGTMIIALAAHKGIVVAAGREASGAVDAWTAGYDGANKETFAKALVTGATSDTFTSIAVHPKGGYVLGGSTSNDFLIVRMDAAGTKVWQVVTGSNNEVVETLTVDALGAVTAAGYMFTTHQTLHYQGLFVRLSADGKVLWSKSYGGKNQDIPEALISEADGHVVSVGETGVGPTYTKAPPQCWVLRLDSNGAVVVEKVHGAKSVHCHAVARLASGQYVVAGATGIYPNRDGWVARLDPKSLEIVAEKTLPGVADDGLLGVQPFGAALALVGFAKSAGAARVRRLLVLDNWSTVRFDRLLGDTATEWAGPLAIDAATNTIVTAVNTDGGKGAPILIRTDSWGNSDCVKSGICAFAKAPCDDGDACTADGCDAKKGCTHSPIKGCGPPACDDGNSCTLDSKLADGSCAIKPATSIACDAGGKSGVCGDGVCKAVGPCPLWAATASGGHPYRIAGTVDGGFIAIHLFGATRLDAAGKTVWKYSAQMNGSDPYRDLALVPGGGFVLAGHDGKQGVVTRLSAEGKAEWVQKVGPNDSAFRAVQQVGSGDFVLAGHKPTADPSTAWFVRIDATGKTLWERVLSGQQAFGITRIAPVADDLVGVGWGKAEGKGSVGIVVRQGTDGTTRWLLKHSMRYHGQLQGVTVAADGTVLTGGGTYHEGANWSAAVGTAAAFSASGKPLWSKELAAPMALVEGAGLSPAGRLILVGASNGFKNRVATWMDLSGKTLVTVTEPAGGGTDQWGSVVATTDGGLVFAGQAGSGAQVIRRTDAWGETDCAKSGLCAFAKDGCHDGDDCTADTCDATKGCTHTPIKDCTPNKDADLDHDGLAGSADPCPTVWNPDGAKDACPAWDGSDWSESQDVSLNQDGMASSWRRTNEPVELPLVNGLLDGSVVGHWRLNGTFAGLTTGEPKSIGTVNPGPGPFGDPSGAIHLDGKTGGAYLSTDRPWRLTGDFSAAMWIRLDAYSGQKTEHLLNTTSGDKCHDGGFQVVREPKVLSFTVVRADGAQPTLTVPAPVTGAWHHLALIRRGVTSSIYLDGSLVASHADLTASKNKDCGNWVALGHERSFVTKVAGRFLAGSLADVVLFNRALSQAEVTTYCSSTAPYGTQYLTGVQADFDDVRITETTPWQKEHGTHFEVIGARPHSDTDLKHVVAYWKLDGNGKNAASDGLALAGKEPAFVLGRFGEAKGAWQPDSTTPTLCADQGAAFLTSEGTWEAWVRPSTCDVAGGRTILQMSAGLYIEKDCAFRVHQEGLGPSFDLKTPSGFAVDTWHHVGFTWNAKSAGLYVDGVLQLSKAAPKLMNPGQPFCVARKDQYGQFPGPIDEVIVHSVAKSADYFAKRARGLPRVRFLAHTAAGQGKGGAYEFHNYRLHWGNLAAKAVATKVVGLDKKTTCDALLSPCLGYAGWWRFDELGGLVLDASSNRNYGKTVGGASATAGVDGAAVDFTGGYALVPAHNSLNAAKYTAELSLRRATSSGDRVLLWKAQTNNLHDDNYNLGLHSNNRFYAIHYPAAGQGATLEGKEETPLNQWARVAATSDGKKLTTWMNGNTMGTLNTGEVPTTTPHPLVFGAASDVGGVSHHFTGAMDEVRIMTRSLTPDEFLHSPMASAHLPLHPGQKAYIPAGPFWMGCNDLLDKDCKPEEKPQHQVNVSAFWLDRYEVTVARYQTCVEAKACEAPSVVAKECSGAWAVLNNWSANGPKPGRLQHPVNCVPIAQMEAFCKWSGGSLPTEAEWEKAARGGCELVGVGSCKSLVPTWPWGEAAPSCVYATIPQGEGGAGFGCGKGTTSPVGSRPAGASPYGAYDMGGNVAEVLRDWYDPKYYDTSPASDPVNLAVSKGRVNRGGSYVESTLRMRSAARGMLTTGQDEMASHIGFRCRYDAK